MSAALNDFVILATADWDASLWTNKQHVACSLAALGKRVLYINSIATRKPRANASDAARILARVKSLGSRPQVQRPNVWTLSPAVLPWHDNDLVAQLNRRMLRLQLYAAERHLGFRNPVLLTYSPLTSHLLNTGGYSKIVYHCVDDIASQPDMPSELIRRSEQILLAEADQVFCTNPVLAERAARVSQSVHYSPNVADYEHFHGAMREGPIPTDLAALPSPRVLFVGAITNYKLNFALIAETARSRPNYSFVFIGPVGMGEGSTDCTALMGIPNLHLIGARTYDELPQYLRGGAVGILPNQLNEYTDCMFPMKFFEYMAAGLPVVSTPLKALQDYSVHCFLAGDASAFANALDAAIHGEGASLEQRLKLAKEHTYEARTLRMLEVIGASSTQER